ncbi:MAG: choice-of-anchor V domain-containing protein [Gemmatimonadales bacterium]
MRWFLSLLILSGGGVGGGALFTDSPPPGHTGGFGEPTCQACHAGGPLDTAGPALRLDSLPGTYEAGATYRITVRLTRAAMARAGFQLSARFADGRQAGTLAALDSLTSVVPLRGVQYVSHTLAGSEAVAHDTARWAVVWTAPAAGQGPVVVHVAANASNDDASPFGDFIHTRHYALEPPR